MNLRRLRLRTCRIQPGEVLEKRPTRKVVLEEEVEEEVDKAPVETVRMVVHCKTPWEVTFVRHYEYNAGWTPMPGLPVDDSGAATVVIPPLDPTTAPSRPTRIRLELNDGGLRSSEKVDVIPAPAIWVECGEDGGDVEVRYHGHDGWSQTTSLRGAWLLAEPGRELPVKQLLGFLAITLKDMQGVGCIVVSHDAISEEELFGEVVEAAHAAGIGVGIDTDPTEGRRTLEVRDEVFSIASKFPVDLVVWGSGRGETETPEVASQHHRGSMLDIAEAFGGKVKVLTFEGGVNSETPHVDKEMYYMVQCLVTDPSGFELSMVDVARHVPATRGWAKVPLSLPKSLSREATRFPNADVTLAQILLGYLVLVAVGADPIVPLTHWFSSIGSSIRHLLRTATMLSAEAQVVVADDFFLATRRFLCDGSPVLTMVNTSANQRDVGLNALHSDSTLYSMLTDGTRTTNRSGVVSLALPPRTGDILTVDESRACRESTLPSTWKLRLAVASQPEVVVEEPVQHWPVSVSEGQLLAAFVVPFAAAVYLASKWTPRIPQQLSTATSPGLQVVPAPFAELRHRAQIAPGEPKAADDFLPVDQEFVPPRKVSSRRLRPTRSSIPTTDSPLATIALSPNVGSFRGSYGDLTKGLYDTSLSNIHGTSLSSRRRSMHDDVDFRPVIASIVIKVRKDEESNFYAAKRRRAETARTDTERQKQRQKKNALIRAVTVLSKFMRVFEKSPPGSKIRDGHLVLSTGQSMSWKDWTTLMGKMASPTASDLGESLTDHSKPVASTHMWWGGARGRARSKIAGLRMGKAKAKGEGSRGNTPEGNTIEASPCMARGIRGGTLAILDVTGSQVPGTPKAHKTLAELMGEFEELKKVAPPELGEQGEAALKAAEADEQKAQQMSPSELNYLGEKLRKAMGKKLRAMADRRRWMDQIELEGLIREKALYQVLEAVGPTRQHLVGHWEELVEEAMLEHAPRDSLLPMS